MSTGSNVATAEKTQKSRSKNVGSDWYACSNRSGIDVI